ncbi:MAG TPA: response regulator, partial [Pyrinomonadaceae bacterium]|nr:response regulator [Pyrinomonadaceae bacterium]
MSASGRILYVNADEDSGDLAGALLKYSDLHCTVVSTESAKEARLLIVKDLFDFYIFDYDMPEISGIELCRCVRRFDSITPVLFFSATARPVDIDEGIKAGADEYLLKSNDLEKLSLTVKRLLDETSQARSRRLITKNRVDLLPETSSEQVLQIDKLQPLIWKDVYEVSNPDSLKIQNKTFLEIDGKTREKRFNQNQIQTDGVGRPRARPLLMVAAIFTVVVLHFVSQIVFFQSEKNSSETEVVSKQAVEIKPEVKPEIKPEIKLQNEPDA